MKLFSFVLILFLFLVSCQKDKEVRLKQSTSKKLVIECYISPQDSVIKVSVRHSEPLTSIIPAGQGYADLVADARVILSGNGNQKYELPFEKYVGYISRAHSIPVHADSTYVLDVTTPDGYKAKSTCVVPAQQVDSNSIRLEKIDEGVYHLTWAAIGEGNKYYSVINNVLYQEPGQAARYDNSARWYGITNDGRQGIVSLLNQRIITNANLSNGYRAELWICQTDYPFYEYTRTLLQQDKDNQNPFGEPLPVYTNIKNGLGVFAALNRTVIHS